MPTDTQVDPFGFLSEVEVEAAIAVMEGRASEPRFPIVPFEQRQEFWRRTGLPWEEVQRTLIERLWGGGGFASCAACGRSRGVAYGYQWGFRTSGGALAGLMVCSACTPNRHFDLGNRYRFIDTERGDRLVRPPRNVDNQCLGVGRLVVNDVPSYELVALGRSTVHFVAQGQTTPFRVPSRRRVDQAIEHLEAEGLIGSNGVIWNRRAVRDVLASEMQADTRCLSWAYGRRCRLSAGHSSADRHSWWNGRRRDAITWS